VKRGASKSDHRHTHNISRRNHPPPIGLPPRNRVMFRRHAMHPSWRGMYRNVTWHRIRLRLLAWSKAIQPASLGYYPQVTSLGCSSLSKSKRRGVSFHPTGGQIISRRPEILPRLHSGIMRREPSVQRVSARDSRPRRWLLVQRDRSATIEDRIVPCLSSNYIVLKNELYIPRKIAIRNRVMERERERLQKNERYCNFK